MSSLLSMTRVDRVLKGRRENERASNKGIECNILRENFEVTLL